MSRIASSDYLPSRRFRLSASHMKTIADACPSCPALRGKQAMLAVERILNGWIEDHVRYDSRPEYQSVMKPLTSIRDSLRRTIIGLRSLSPTGQPVNDYLYAALEAGLRGSGVGQRLSLETCLAAMLALQTAADSVSANLKTVYGQSGGDGKPSAVALDLWIERMFCLYDRLGGDTTLSWRSVSADVSTDDETLDVNFSESREGEFVDLLRAIIAIVDQYEKEFPAGLLTNKNSFGRALGQRVFRVITAWRDGTPSQRKVRLEEIEHFLLSEEELDARLLANRRDRHRKKLKSAIKERDALQLLSTEPAAERGVTYLDEGRQNPPMVAHATKEEREDAEADKPRKVRRPNRSRGEARPKPARR